MNTAERATLAGRRQAEKIMVNTATITRNTGETYTDPETYEVIPVVTTVYDGRCRVRTYSPQESTPESAGATITVQRYEVHFPAGTFQALVGDVVTITAAALDPYLVGRQFRVVALHHEALATAYRLGVEIIE